MWNKGFEGWYFRQQKGDEIIAFIPGRAESGCFVQMIDHGGSRQFSVGQLRVQDGVIYADDCVFSSSGISINLPAVQGKVQYSGLTPLRSDIMGPFRYFPMECRHGVISMSHELSGTLTVDGIVKDFSGGKGYIEKDSGTSFPSDYLWLQCNDFPLPCSIMLSVARIPFAGLHFRGCICAVIYGGQEYRFATYCGVRICVATPQRILLSQGKLRLEVEVLQESTGHPLRSPVQGQMSGIVRESNHVRLRVRMWNDGAQLLDLTSSHAAYEYLSRNTKGHSPKK